MLVLTELVVRHLRPGVYVRAKMANYKIQQNQARWCCYNAGGVSGGGSAPGEYANSWIMCPRFTRYRLILRAHSGTQHHTCDRWGFRKSG